MSRHICRIHFALRCEVDVLEATLGVGGGRIRPFVVRTFVENVLYAECLEIVAEKDCAVATGVADRVLFDAENVLVVGEIRRRGWQHYVTKH